MTTPLPGPTPSFPPFFGGASPSQTANSTGNDSNSGGGNSGGGGSLAASSSLYLFTFLATLLLLLAVSCAIILRSLVIRRRFQRRVQEALAQGIVLPPAPDQRRRAFGEKPKLWDAWIAPEDGNILWHNMTPVSVRVLSDKLTGAGRQAVGASPRTTLMQTASVGLARAQRWRPPFLHGRSRPGPTPTTAPGDLSMDDVPPGPIVEDARLQVSVLIAMPSQHRPRAWAEHESGASADEHGLKGKARSVDDHSYMDVDDEVPDVVFGAAEVQWKVLVEKPSGPP
ncbi:hypothetical protein M0805_004456 [Coniferiporia weirii]|nr:hypothetical protein M0805_004456 [Coniferiporia weirii]